MGNRQNMPKIAEDILDEYVILTYLPKSEIIYILKSFYSMGPNEMDHYFYHRFHKNLIMEKFPVLKYNPFRARMFQVFSSLQDDCLSFEDMLDMCSVMSEYCPTHVKAMWAFKLFDIDDDNQISIYDICDIIDRLTYAIDENSKINNDEKMKISKIILNEMDVQCVGSLGPAEFSHLISKIPEFRTSFYFKI